MMSENKEVTAAKRGIFIPDWPEKEVRRQRGEINRDAGIARSKSRGRKQGVVFQSVVDFRALQRQSIRNADMIQRFPV